MAEHLRFSIAQRTQPFLGWVAICEDITLRKTAEDELRRINQALGTQLNDISKLEDQLREQIKRDTLTGVYNRGYLEEVLKHEISKAKLIKPA